MGVFGTGAVGMAALIAAKLRNPEVLVAVDVVPERLKRRARHFGATHAVNAKTDNVVERIREITRGAGLTAALDTTGVAAVARNAIDALGARGHLVTCAAPPAGHGDTRGFPGNPHGQDGERRDDGRRGRRRC